MVRKRMHVKTLLDICLAKTATLLIDCYWPVGYYCVSDCIEVSNPFMAVPTHLVEELIACVTQEASSGTLSVQHLYFLLSSRRVKNFKLEKILIQSEEFIGILAVLAVRAITLRGLILRQVFCLDSEEKYEVSRSTAIECLLSMSPNLEHVEIDHWFNFKALRTSRCLRHLEIMFPPKNPLFDLMPRFRDRSYISNDHLVFFSIYEDYHNKISVEEMAFILQHCPNLLTIENNIATALEFLHGEQLFCGSLSKRYNLQKYVLGSVYALPVDAVASVSVIQIAAITCPDTKQLDVLVNDHQAISVFVDFKHLESFLIQWETATSGDYRLGLHFALRDIGCQFRQLTIINFNNVDFEEIGRFCPILNELKVEFESESSVDSKDLRFQQLSKLHLQCEGADGIKDCVVLFVLSGCKKIASLCLDFVPCLTDQLMDKILRRNSLAQLKEISLNTCSLTAHGLQSLVRSCPLLEYCRIQSSYLLLEEAAEIIHEINPFIIVT